MNNVKKTLDREEVVDEKAATMLIPTRMCDFLQLKNKALASAMASLLLGNASDAFISGGVSYSGYSLRRTTGANAQVITRFSKHPPIKPKGENG